MRNNQKIYSCYLFSLVIIGFFSSLFSIFFLATEPNLSGDFETALWVIFTIGVTVLLVAFILARKADMKESLTKISS